VPSDYAIKLCESQPLGLPTRLPRASRRHPGRGLHGRSAEVQAGGRGGGL